MVADGDVFALHNEPIDEVTYFFTRDGWEDCVVIDPFDVDEVLRWLDAHRKRCSHILLTHEHYDHVAAVNALKDRQGGVVVASEACAENVKDPRKNFSMHFDVLMEFHGQKLDKKTQPYAVEHVDVAFRDRYVFSVHGVDVEMTATPGHSPGSACIRIGKRLFTGDSLLRDTPVITKFPNGSRRDYAAATLPYLQAVEKDVAVYPGHGEAFLMGESNYL